MEEDERFNLDLNVADEPVHVPALVAQALDDLVVGLTKLGNKETPAAVDLAAALECITRWLVESADRPGEGEPSPWTASYMGSPEMGGSLMCQNENLYLLFSLDANRRPYQCVWGDQAGSPGSEVYVGLEQIASGLRLNLKSASTTNQLALPPAQGLALWGSATLFFQNLARLRMPAVSEQVTSPQESGDIRPAAIEAQPEEIQRCAQCGAPLRPGKKFCGKCGAPSVQVSVTRACVKCGNTLSAKARFCGKCGSPQP